MKKLIFTFCLLFSIVTNAFAGMQEKREKLIQELIDARIFKKVEIPAKLPHLWVGPAFYALDYDAKSNFVNVVYAYYITMSPSYNIVVLYDSKTGKKIGRYSEADGGLNLF